MEVRLSPHDEARVAEIRSTHRRNRRVCAACGQSWPCTEIAWVTEREPVQRWTRAERARFAAGVVVLGVVLPFGLSRILPVPASVVLLVLIPVAVGAALVMAGWRR